MAGPVLRSRPGPIQAPPGPVVTDVVVLSDRSPQPVGYTRAPEFPEPRKCCPKVGGDRVEQAVVSPVLPPAPPAGPGGARKKRLYVKLQPVSAADTAVVDIKLSSKSKTLPSYTRAGYGMSLCLHQPFPSPFSQAPTWFCFREMGNFAIWCKKGPVLKPVPRPRSISTGLKQLSLQSPDHGYTHFIPHLSRTWPSPGITPVTPSFCSLHPRLVLAAHLSRLPIAPGHPLLPAASNVLLLSKRLSTTPPTSTASQVIKCFFPG